MSQRQLEENRTSGRTWKLLSAIVAIVVVLGLFSACSQEVAGPRQAGDEPPIRVRNGSLELKLLTQTNDFEPENPNDPNDKKNWKIKNGSRGKPEYEVFIHATDMSKCGNRNYAKTNKVEFGYGTAAQESQKIKLQITGNNTKIQADKNLRYDNQDGKFLRYEVANEFIRRIGIGNEDEFCKFDSNDAALKVVLIDPISDDK